jgi:glycosyltransferase involved in cell wall biosynthesis
LPTSIVFTVINDLNFDQRMQRICTALADAGYKITLVGRILPHSKPLPTMPFEQVRLKNWFNKGKLFYIEYNLRLAWWLLRHKFDVYSATDLDTALPQYFAAHFWHKKPFVYDAHEYFPHLPEIINRPLVKRFWLWVERTIAPAANAAYTVSDSYAQIFKQKYGKTFGVVRNATVLQPQHQLPNLPNNAEIFNKTYILYQGAVNIGRGIEQVIEAMPLINENCFLYICGDGDVLANCKALVNKLNLQNSVHFFGRIPPEQLRMFTQHATLGFTFFSNQGLSYELSLANRFFDYMHAGVPQLCSNFTEYAAINAKYQIALLLPNLQPAQIAQAANQLLNDPKLYQSLRQNCLAAREVYNWQNEAKTLLTIYQNIAPAPQMS